MSMLGCGQVDGPQAYDDESCDWTVADSEGVQKCTRHSQVTGGSGSGLLFLLTYSRQNPLQKATVEGCVRMRSRSMVCSRQQL